MNGPDDLRRFAPAPGPSRHLFCSSKVKDPRLHKSLELFWSSLTRWRWEAPRRCPSGLVHTNKRSSVFWGAGGTRATWTSTQSVPSVIQRTVWTSRRSTASTRPTGCARLRTGPSEAPCPAWRASTTSSAKRSARASSRRSSRYVSPAASVGRLPAATAAASVVHLTFK